MQPVERAYHPEYFKIMNTITAVTVAAWLEKVLNDEFGKVNLHNTEEADTFFNGVLWKRSGFLLNPIKDFIHEQFTATLRMSMINPETELDVLVTELFNDDAIMLQTVSSSKMKDAPYPFTATTAGFGSGILTLMLTDVLQRLYSETHFPSLKAATSIAKIDFQNFSVNLPHLGVFNEEYEKALLLRSRILSVVQLDGDSMDGLNEQGLKDWNFAPGLANAGCVGLYPPPKDYRQMNSLRCSNIPSISAIGQLNTYLVPMMDNLISWAKKKGGTPFFEGKISPIDLGILNGTHPNLPKHPDTRVAPLSLID